MGNSQTAPDNLKMSNITDDPEDKMMLELHECIRKGKIFEAISFTQELSLETRQRLTKANEELGLKPAIFAAIEEMDIGFVEFLVDFCKADIEETYESENTFDAASGKSPLEFVFCRSQFLIFEFLLIAGADPTTLLKDRKAIIKACYSSFLPLNSLQMLADRGADFNASDDKGITCLMYTVRHADRCRFLVDKGVDLNAKNNQGETALHIAAKTNCYYSLKVLVENGADPYIKNIAGYDPLHLACLNRCEETVNYLLETVFTDVNRQIESYQLLGIRSLSYYDMTKTLTAWKKAIDLFVKNRIQRPAATLDTPFGVAVEATSFSEIDTMSRDLVARQSLVLTHKIFGPNHELFFASIASSSNRYCKAGLFDQWMQMLTYCVRMIRDSSLAQREGCAQVEMILLGIYRGSRNLFESKSTLHFSLVYEFTEAVVQIVRKYIEFDEKKIFGDLIFTSMVPFFSVAFEDHQTCEFKKLVRCAVATIRGKQKRTVLIDALCCWMANGKPIATFPLLAAVTMLLECGADVDERDQNDNNVVHFLSDFGGSVFSLREIVVRCVEYGIHLDARNRKGMTTSECLHKFQILTTPPINLMCIAARSIRKYQIRVAGILPQFLIDFVEMH